MATHTETSARTIAVGSNPLTSRVRHYRREDSLYTCASNTYAETLACYHTTAIRWAIKSGASLREPYHYRGVGLLPAQVDLSTSRPKAFGIVLVPSTASQRVVLRSSL